MSGLTSDQRIMPPYTGVTKLASVLGLPCCLGLGLRVEVGVLVGVGVNRVRWRWCPRGCGRNPAVVVSLVSVTVWASGLAFSFPLASSLVLPFPLVSLWASVSSWALA